MNLVYGEIVAISQNAEMREAKIRVGGAMKTVSLDRVAAAAIGDSILLCDGIAIAKVDQEEKTENHYVSGHSREAH